MSASIVVLLATRNGSEFLAKQIDSLLLQTENQWNLLIRDDCSTDGTQSIIQKYQEKSDRIRVLINDGSVCSSALGNFSKLLEAAYEHGAEYIFCCDQDDVWEPGKLELLVARLKDLEGESSAPCLVHHDLTVVDRYLDPVAGSFIELMQLQPSSQLNPQRLISRNEVTGCAMAFNRTLLEIALPISAQAVMHDWWLALCAGYFGHLDFVSDKLVKYRQHGENVIGAKSFWHALNPFTNWIAGWRRGDEDFIDSVKQARAFRDAMADRFDRSSEAFESLDSFCKLLTASRWQRLKALRNCGLWRTHWVLNVVMVLRMLLLPRASER